MSRRSSTVGRPKSLNAQYLDCLARYPLLTKSITAAALAALNEQLASLFANDIKQTQLTETITLKHTWTKRVPLMALFGFAVNAPVSHYGYNALNSAFKAPLTPKKKVLQIVTSLLTISPVLNALMVAYIALIGTALSPVALIRSLHKGGMPALKEELHRAWSQVSTSFRRSYLPVLKSSWITTPIAMAIAQNYLSPNLWVVFFNVVYFVLGTYNNTLVKMARKTVVLDGEPVKREETVKE